MFFYKKHKHKHKRNKGGCSSSCGKVKEKKRFGLTNLEMDELLIQMRDKPKIPIAFIN